MVRGLVVVAFAQALLIAWLVSQRGLAAPPVVSDRERGTGTSSLIRGGDGEAVSREEGTEAAGEQADGPDSGTAPAAAGADRNADGAPSPVVPPTIMHGRIAYSNGDEVSRWNEIWMVAEGREAIAVRARKDGTFATAGLPPGRYRAYFETWGTRGTVTTIDLAPGERIRRDFTYESYREIPVRILTSAGKRFGEVVRAGRRGAWPWLEYQFVVAATDGPPRGGPPMLASLEGGDFGLGRYAGQGKYADDRMTDGRDGTLHLPPGTNGPVHVSLFLRSHLLETRKLETIPESLTFTLDEDRFRALTSGVTFRLSGEGEDSKLEVAGISLQASQMDGVQMTPHEEKDGQFTIRGKIPGCYRLSLFAEGLEDWSREIVLPPGELLDLGTIRLREITGDSLVFRDTDGDPVPGVAVYVTDLAVDPDERSWEVARSSDTDGGFLIPHAPGRYVLGLVDPSGGIHGIELELPLHGDEPRAIVLPPTRPVNVRLAPKLAGPVTYEIQKGDGGLLLRKTWSFPHIWVDELADGDYTLVVREGDGTVHRRELRVGPGPVPFVVFGEEEE